MQGEQGLAAADERARDVVRMLRENRFVFDRSAATRYRGSLGSLVGVGDLEAGGEVEVVE